MAKGLGCWNTMPMCRRTATGSTFVVVDILAAEVDVALEAEAADEVVHAVDAAQTVLLPQPEGPMKAVMVFFFDRDMRVADGLEACRSTAP